MPRYKYRQLGDSSTENKTKTGEISVDTEGLESLGSLYKFSVESHLRCHNREKEDRLTVTTLGTYLWSLVRYKIFHNVQTTRVVVRKTLNNLYQLINYKKRQTLENSINYENELQCRIYIHAV